jgi:adenine-specific DNA methylase
MDFREALAEPKLRFEVVYADPPYTRDHYSRYYHALETMCLRDNPVISTATIGGKVVLSRGLYREERHQSPFCIKSQAPEAFDALCKAVARRGSALVLSYSPFDHSRGERPRVTSVELIERVARQYFRAVEIDSPGEIAHSKLTSTDMTVDTQSQAEQVLICRHPRH